MNVSFVHWRNQKTGEAWLPEGTDHHGAAGGGLGSSVFESYVHSPLTWDVGQGKCAGYTSVSSCVKCRPRGLCCWAALSVREYMTSCPSVTPDLTGTCSVVSWRDQAGKSREACPVLSSGLSVGLMFVCPSAQQTDVWSASGDAERPREPTAHHTGVSGRELRMFGEGWCLADGGGRSLARAKRLEAQLLRSQRA